MASKLIQQKATAHSQPLSLGEVRILTIFMPQAGLGGPAAAAGSAYRCSTRGQSLTPSTADSWQQQSTSTRPCSTCRCVPARSCHWLALSVGGLLVGWFCSPSRGGVVHCAVSGWTAAGTPDGNDGSPELSHNAACRSPACQVPTSCPGVPSKLLQPHLQWHDTADYTKALDHLAQLFTENFRHVVSSSLSSSCDSKSRQLAGTGFMQTVAAGGPGCSAAAAVAEAAHAPTISSGSVLAPGTP
jgi:hypothetical protein